LRADRRLQPDGGVFGLFRNPVGRPRDAALPALLGHRAAQPGRVQQLQRERLPVPQVPVRRFFAFLLVLTFFVVKYRKIELGFM